MWSGEPAPLWLLLSIDGGLGGVARLHRMRLLLASRGVGLLRQVMRVVMQRMWAAQVPGSHEGGKRASICSHAESKACANAGGAFQTQCVY